jgi:hypothetical protein
MSNKYLLEEEPKSFSPTIAQALDSISKAVIIQQIHFWLFVYTKKGDRNHFFNGHYWVFNSYNEWHKDLSFIKFATMKRQILELEKDGLLISDEFNKNRGNRTKWYRIDYEALAILTKGVELNRLVHFEPPSDHFEPPSDHFEPPSDHFDPLCQSDHQSDHQSDPQSVYAPKAQNLQIFIKVFNTDAPKPWIKQQTIDSFTTNELLRFVKEFQGDSAEIFQNGLLEAQKDEYWNKRKLSLKNYLAKNLAFDLAQKYLNRSPENCSADRETEKQRLIALLGG